ncbi:nucleoside deaminase [Bartonella tamiae]|uniref:tRNA-specific adenosine deaminase n=1 Tax=Bartonella tamiae Th239 TaxID=1094558 RepID=J1K160_9HYPH|nr:nucleoside deaminase [Bartonella tamiae]EJF90790.1 hypothetical protein ME5_00626 [Bartonella tamiae Th239]EJF93425.1 hypothetical protein MEG_01256 [Bartonella tamiae Th307]
MAKKPMDIALYEANLAANRDEVPVGAVIVQNGNIIAQAGNLTRHHYDPTGHAEILAIRMACHVLQSDRLPQCDLYVTLEPCTMCAAAISFARIRRLYYAASDPKGGAVENGVCFFHQNTCHHAPEIYSGFAQSDAENLLKNFFRTKRDRP